MLDRFIYGNVERISPEAPIPVLHYRKEAQMPGGAANVARNIVALGGRAILAGIVGTDEAGRVLDNELNEKQGIEAYLIKTQRIPTIVKTRFVSGGQQIMRLDVEMRLQMDVELENEIYAAFKAVSERIDAVILSDYAKGLLSAALVKRVIEFARECGLPVVVDPKTANIDHFCGATVITPNALEAAMITGIRCISNKAAHHAARDIATRISVSGVIVTRGADGMTLYAPEMGVAEALHIPANASEVFDVSGAGDTVVATIALALVANCGIAEAAKIANVAAGISIGKHGTSVVYPHELRGSVSASSHASDGKIVGHVDAAEIIGDWKRAGLRVGFTNGCYDLLHPGHISLLRKARAACDRLVVALNTDASVRRLKGETRPVQNEMARATVMASVNSVDLVTLFDEDTPLSLIQKLRPDVLVKGADYTVATVVGSDYVINNGGEVVLIPLEEGHSTTSIIARSKTGASER